MIRGTEPGLGERRGKPAEGLGYPFRQSVARAARGPTGRDGPEREQDGTA
jgi:hypothetical protein